MDEDNANPSGENRTPDKKIGQVKYAEKETADTKKQNAEKKPEKQGTKP